MTAKKSGDNNHFIKKKIKTAKVDAKDCLMILIELLFILLNKTKSFTKQ